MLFDKLPIELNNLIFEYYNYYQQEHKIHFDKTLNFINKIPKFLTRFKHRARRGMIIYYIFQDENCIHYIIENKKYFNTINEACKKKKINLQKKIN